MTDVVSNCLPATGSTIWPMVALAVAIAGGGLALQRLALRRRGSLAMLALVVLGAAAIAVLAPRVDASANDCGVSSGPPEISEERVESIPIVPDAFVPDGVITPDQPVDVSLDGFQPDEEVDIYVASVPRWLGTAIVDASGRFRFRFRIPTDLKPGAHNLFVLGRRSGRAIRQPVTLVDSSTPTSSTTIPNATTTTSTTASTTTSTTTTVPSSTTSTTASTTTSTSTSTTTTESTTTTTASSAPIQTLTWGVESDWSISDSPVQLPVVTTNGSWWLTPTYSVVSAGTTNCALDPSTRVLTFDTIGSCEVRATFPGWWDQWAETSTTVTIEIGAAAVCDQSMTYQRGDVGPGGGRIFYVSPTCHGWGRYLEVAPGDWTGSTDGTYQPKWCDSNRSVAGTSSTGLGRGIRNTLALLGDCSETPALRAQAYRGGGMVDWAVPTSGELIELCKWAHGRAQSDDGCGSYGNYAQDYGFSDHYWSSTQNGETSAIENWMPGGQDFRTVTKDTTYVKVRPVRAFGLAGQVGASWTTTASFASTLTNDYTLDFSESITGLTGEDITNIGSATGCVFVPASSSGSSIAVSVTCTSDGTVIPLLDVDSVSGSSTTGPARPVTGRVISIDSTAPTISVGSIPTTMVPGIAFSVASDERGWVYMVRDTVSTATVADLLAAADDSANSVTIATEDTDTTLETSGLGAGTYHLIAVDRSGNISVPFATNITVRASQACTTSCLIGDTGPGGGTVFYDAGSVQSWGRYLEFAPSSWRGGDSVWPDLQYCDVDGSLGSTGSAIGTGYSNTMRMLAGCSSGIAIDAQSYRGGGLVDWFVPSIDEMSAVCRWVKARPYGATNCGGWDGGYVNGSGFTSHYWTSTEIDSTNAMETYVPGGQDYRTVIKAGPGWGISLRPIRAFGGNDLEVAIAPDQARSTSQTLGFTLEFSESITGLIAADLSNIGTAGGCTFTPASSSGASIHVTVVCTSDGTVVVRIAPDSVTGAGSTGPALAANSSMVPIDSVVPTVSATAPSNTLVIGSGIDVSMSERGDLYVVASTVTVADRASITSAADAEWNTVYAPSTAAVVMRTTGLDAGTYRVYAVDQAGNVSSVHPTTFTLRAAQSCTTSCLIGDIGPGGGRVVYDAGSVQSWGRYLEVASANTSYGSERAWCDSNTVITGADGTAIGTGLANSIAISAACTTAAAKDAMAYDGGGLSDWFLPSIEEMRAVCRWSNLDTGSTGCVNAGMPNNLSFPAHIWTSTQIDASTAWETWIPGGNDYRTVVKSGPGWGILVRPVRYF